MKIILAAVIILFSTGLFAQQGSIRGTVLDQEMNNEPLLFANISLKGTNISEPTNLFGNFQIDAIESGQYILEISFAGYDTKEISVNVKANETIKLQESLAAITFDFDEVLVDEKSNSLHKIVSTSNNSVGQK